MGLPVTAHLTAGALIPGILGGAAVVLDMPVERADRALTWAQQTLAAAGVPAIGCCRRQASSSAASTSAAAAAGCVADVRAGARAIHAAADCSGTAAAAAAAASPVDAASDDELSQLIARAPASTPQVARFSTEPLDERGGGYGHSGDASVAASPAGAVDARSDSADATTVSRAAASAEVDMPAAAGSGGWAALPLAACGAALRRSPAVLVAFCVLAVTTGIGIVVATYFEQVAKLNRCVSAGAWHSACAARCASPLQLSVHMLAAVSATRQSIRCYCPSRRCRW